MGWGPTTPNSWAGVALPGRSNRKSRRLLTCVGGAGRLLGALPKFVVWGGALTPTPGSCSAGRGTPRIEVGVGVMMSQYPPQGPAIGDAFSAQRGWIPGCGHATLGRARHPSHPHPKEACHPSPPVPRGRVAAPSLRYCIAQYSTVQHSTGQ